MNLIRKAVTTLGGILLAVLLIVALAPRAARGVAAALIRDVDQPARHPFTTGCSATASGGEVSCDTPVMPSGEQIVIETESLQGVGDPGNAIMSPSLGVTTGGTGLAYAFSAVRDDGTFQPYRTEVDTTTAFRLYADPGTTIACSESTGLNSNPKVGLTVGCSLSGYWVSLP